MPARPSRTRALEELGRQLGNLAVRLQAQATETALRFHPSLPPAAFHVARWLDSFGPARVGTIADGVAMDRTAVSRLVGQLEAAGMAESLADPGDRRAQLVRLTTAGTRDIAAAVGWKATEYYRRLDGWTVEDITTLSTLLGRLNAG